MSPGNYVMLAFSDTGAGMDAETLQKIFEPFFSRKPGGTGTGLGLSTVFGIVRQNGGIIHPYSEPGQGTTFKIYLPRARPEAEELVEPPPEIRLAGTQTVLITEDEEQVLNLAKAVLESYGYEVLAARTPAEAMHLVREGERDIHLLLTDVIMPEMNGRELQAQIQRIKPGIKTLFMSGYTANVIARQGVLEEGIAFLPKPFSVVSLAQKVREVLDS